jgi:hypothetical protein
MRRYILKSKVIRPVVLFLLLLALIDRTPLITVSGQTVAPPRFTVELVKVDSAALPALHSFSLGQANGKWLIVGGRTNGLHSFVQSSNGGKTAPSNAFPFTQANTNIWVIDPVEKKSWSIPVSDLPADCTGTGSPQYNCADTLAANNAQSYQDGDTLYIIGGYGQNSKTGQMATFGSLTAIKVTEAIDAIIGGKSLAPFIQQTTTYFDCPQYASTQYNSCVGTGNKQCKTGPGWADCRKRVAANCRIQRAAATQTCINKVQSGKTEGLPTNTGYYAKVAGGGLERIGNTFYLVFGQQFEGLYSDLESDYGKWPTKQVYTERIAALQFMADPLAAAVLNVIQQDPSDSTMPYHRRDLNVLPALNPDGSQRIAVHGGVFVPGQDAAYQDPILIDNGANPMNVRVTVDKSYQQLMSQYDCATLTMFDSAAAGGGNMINVFFGGIGLYYVEPRTLKLKKDEGLPFINSITAMTHYANGSWSEFIRMAPMDGLMGADAKFVPDPTVAHAGDGVIYLDRLKNATLVGYIYGGIISDIGETGGDSQKFTRSSNALYEVHVRPSVSRTWIRAIPSATLPRTNRSVETNKAP